MTTGSTMTKCNPSGSFLKTAGDADTLPTPHHVITTEEFWTQVLKMGLDTTIERRRSARHGFNNFFILKYYDRWLAIRDHNGKPEYYHIGCSHTYRQLTDREAAMRGALRVLPTETFHECSRCGIVHCGVA